MAAAEPRGGGPPLTEEQRAAVALAAGPRGLVVITGGPGTGKTAVLGALAERLAAAGVPFAFAAPTGTAAENAAAVLPPGVLSTTLAGMMVDPAAAEAVAEGVLVMDEASMVTLERLDEAVAVLRPRRVVLVGDADQLPPQPEDDGSGATPLFADLVALGRRGVLPLAVLTRNFRQAGAGRLGAAVAALRESPRPLGRAELRRGGAAGDESLRFVDGADPLGATTTTTTGGQVPVFLCCSNATRVQLNERLQRRFNPAGAEAGAGAGAGAGASSPAARVGDPVVCTRNLRDAAGRFLVTNGTRGVLEAAAADGAPVVRYRRADGAPLFADAWDPARRRFASEFEVAYAMTVHKAQGQGLPHVVVVVEGYETHAWLYTAVSRASASCVLFGATDERLRAITARRAPAGALGPAGRALAAFDFAQLDVLAE